MELILLGDITKLPCDRCSFPSAQFAVMCGNGHYHAQCLECALHTDKERRWENREFAWLN